MSFEWMVYHKEVVEKRQNYDYEYFWAKEANSAILFSGDFESNRFLLYYVVNNILSKY